MGPGEAEYCLLADTLGGILDEGLFMREGIMSHDVTIECQKERDGIKSNQTKSDAFDAGINLFRYLIE